MKEGRSMNFENQYLTYKEYLELGGKNIGLSFNSLEYRAEKKVDELTSSRFRRVNPKEYPRELKMCMYDLINIFDSEGDCGIVSESVGNYSQTRESKQSIEKTKENIISQYLSDVKVNGIYALYRGADTCED